MCYIKSDNTNIIDKLVFFNTPDKKSVILMNLKGNQIHPGGLSMSKIHTLMCRG